MIFQDLHLISPLLKALAKEGFSEPTEIQSQVIQYALEWTDILWCAQTGSGKTLAFWLPILQNIYMRNRETERMEFEKAQEIIARVWLDKDWDEKTKKKKKKVKKIRNIQSLILAPTRELAIQIGESLSPYAVNANCKHTVIYWWKNQFHQVKAIEKWVDILIATPGRLLDLIWQWYIKLNNITIFTLDEADKMLEMGFIEDIQKVIKLLPNERQTLFFSATMPPKIKKLADTILYKPKEITIEKTVESTPDITQEVYLVDQAQKRQLLQYIIKKEKYSSIIVFVKTKDDTETVLSYVHAAWIEADNIHRNRSQNARIRSINKLKSWEIKVLVATDIASRWIDIDNLSCVINYDLPQEAETYVHRIWRTARAGKKWVSISFCVDAQKAKLIQIEELIWKNISVSKNTKYKDEVVAKWEFIWRYSSCNKNVQEDRKTKNMRYYKKKKKLH